MMHKYLSLTYMILLAFGLTIFGKSDLSAQQWERVGDAPFLKHHTNGFGFNGKAYLLEGIGNNTDIGGVSNEMWLYDPDSMTFTRLPDFPGPSRAIAIGDDWNGKYYYGFGSSGGPTGGLSDLWEFDPVDTSWTQLPPCPCVGRTHPALIAHNDKIFMGAGRSRTGDLNDWWEYDMTTRQWSQKRNIPGPVRHHPFHFAMGNDIYVGGGHISNWLRWDPDAENWTVIANDPLGRVAGTQFSRKGYGYVLAGDKTDHTHLDFGETFMRYNPVINDWETLPPLPNGSRWAPSSFIIDDMLYFLNGVDYDNTSDASMWRFNLASLDNPTSIDSDFDQTVFAYPNPFQQAIRLNGLTTARGTLNAKVINIVGETVMSIQNQNVDATIDLSALKNGVYFLIPEENAGFSSIKLVKQQ